MGISYTIQMDLPQGSKDVHVPVGFAKDKLIKFSFNATQNVAISTNAPTGAGQEVVPVTIGKPTAWERQSAPFIQNPFSGDVDGLYVTSDKKSRLTLRIEVDL